MPDTPTDITLLEPYYAGLSGKTPEERAALQRRIDALPESIYAFLFSDELAEGLERIIRQYRIDVRYFVAIGKIVFLVILGDVSLASASELLQKVGLDKPTSSALSSELTVVCRPLVAARASQAAPQGMKPLQPLTQRLSTSAPPPVPVRRIDSLT